MHYRIFFFPAVLFVFVLFATFSHAKNITLTWDKNPESDIVGYKLYYKGGSSSLPFDGADAIEGGSPIDVGNITTYTVTGMDEGEIYYFAVTAVNEAGLESDFSNVTASEWIPVPSTPQDGVTVSPENVNFAWSPAPADSNVRYTLYYGTDPTFGAAGTTFFKPFNRIGGYALAGMSLIALLGAALPNRKVKGLVTAGAFGAALLVAACGGGGGGGDDQSYVDPGDINSNIGGGSDVVTDPSAGGDNTGSTPPTTGGTGTNPPTTGGSGDYYNPGNQPPQADPGVELFTEEIFNIDGNSYTVNDLEPGTKYYWKVVAVDGQGNVRESSVRNFSTE